MSGTIRCQFIIIASLASGTIRCQFIIIASLAWTIRCRDNSDLLVHHYCFPWTIRCQFIIIASLAWDNSVSGQFGVSSSLLLPLHQVGKLDSWEHLPRLDRRLPYLPRDQSWTIRVGQFGVSSSLLLPLHQSVSWIQDNSVSVHHYCFPCIKSVSWIHGKTSKTDRR